MAMSGNICSGNTFLVAADIQLVEAKDAKYPIMHRPALTNKGLSTQNSSRAMTEKP